MLTVNEIFYSIQGEGTHAGLPCIFVRLTGCPLRCAYCDTAYAFSEGERRSEEEILAQVARYPCRLVEVTGGEPLAQPDAFPLLSRLADRGFEVMVETSGHIPLDRLDARVSAILDVKTPGSGESHRMEWRNLDLLKPRDQVKFVIVDRADYEWSRGIVAERGLGPRTTVLFSPSHGVLAPAQLARWILDDGLTVRLQLQLHKYVWPGVERGV